MRNGEYNETRDLWNRVADDWRRQVGDEGDANRILNSDPVLWAFVGDVKGRTVLAAGCGTGYLSKKLQDRGARVTGMDFSERMLEVACAHHEEYRGATKYARTAYRAYMTARILTRDLQA